MFLATVLAVVALGGCAAKGGAPSVGPAIDEHPPTPVEDCAFLEAGVERDRCLEARSKTTPPVDKTVTETPQPEEEEIPAPAEPVK